MGACWHNLANTTESSVCFGDAAFLSNYFDHLFIMAALRSRCGHYIFALWFLSFYLFFLALSQRPQIGCLPYFDTWCGLSANLECRSEMCCTWLTANAGPKKVAKNRHLGTIGQLSRAISSQLRRVSTIGKKLVKQQYLLHMSP